MMMQMNKCFSAKRAYYKHLQSQFQLHKSYSGLNMNPLYICVCESQMILCDTPSLHSIRNKSLQRCSTAISIFLMFFLNGCHRTKV